MSMVAATMGCGPVFGLLPTDHLRQEIPHVPIDSIASI